MLLVHAVDLEYFQVAHVSVSVVREAEQERRVVVGKKASELDRFVVGCTSLAEARLCASVNVRRHLPFVVPILGSVIRQQA